jgi:hypothetical protein
VKTVKLRKPIEIAGKGAGGEPSTEIIEELHFREEVVSGDLRGIKASELADPPVDMVMKVAGRLCGQPDHVMARLGMHDTGEVGALVIGFLSAGEPKSGIEPSP